MIKKWIIKIVRWCIKVISFAIKLVLFCTMPFHALVKYMDKEVKSLEEIENKLG